MFRSFCNEEEGKSNAIVEEVPVSSEDEAKEATISCLEEGIIVQ